MVESWLRLWGITVLSRLSSRSRQVDQTGTGANLMTRLGGQVASTTDEDAAIACPRTRQSLISHKRQGLLEQFVLGHSEILFYPHLVVSG